MGFKNFYAMKSFPLKYVVALAFTCLFVSQISAKEKNAWYQITVYHFTSSSQEALIDRFLKDALLPELHKKGIMNVGVFKPITNDTAGDKTVFVLRTFKSIEKLTKSADELWNVSSFGSAASEYINSDSKTPPYTRTENMVVKAFDMAPKLTLPNLTSAKNNHIYEFRSYEAANERLHNSKVHMFNQGGEVALFSRLNFNAVFYGTVVAGSKMPNLVYMTSFENMVERDAHWKAFSADPEWKRLSSLSQYQNTVSHADIVIMKAADYSDF